jgi:hypothetical protein
MVFFLRLHIPTPFFLFPQAPSQSESEPEKAPLCDVPSLSPSAFAEMGSDHAESSVSKIPEDVDKDEFGYSWSKLSFFVMHLIIRGIKIALGFLRLSLL